MEKMGGHGGFRTRLEVSSGKSDGPYKKLEKGGMYAAVLEDTGVFSGTRGTRGKLGGGTLEEEPYFTVHEAAGTRIHAHGGSCEEKKGGK